MASRLIASKDNALFKKIKKLKSRKYRESEMLFIAEGFKFLEFDIKPEIIAVNEEKEHSLAHFLNNEEYVIFPNSMFNEISSQENSQGIILVYKYKENKLNGQENSIVVIDRVQDPGNLGTIIRTADAAGFKDIILIEGTTDIYSEKCVRSSMGSIFNVNLYFLKEEEFIKFSKENGYNIISTALDEKSINYDKMKICEKNCIIFGNEGNGISQKILEKSNELVIIPIYGKAESLNVAVAAGITLYKLRELIGRR
jgi:RNA methyltransferase, TrmH family